MSLRSSVLPKAVLAAVSVALLTATACSSDDDSSGSSAESATARGPITYVEGKDTTETGVVRQLIDQWNSTHPDEEVTLKEEPSDADQAHDDMVQHLQAKESDYDVLALDVIWTAEFAAKGWLQPLKDDFAVDTAGLLEPTVASGTYNGTLYAAPKNTNGGLLFYRKDLVPNPPTTWAEMMGDCGIAKQNNIGCYSGQFAAYEGLTVNTSEGINANGGAFVGPDGRTATVDSPQARAGLQSLVDGFKDGNIPAEAITFKEQDSQQAFESGKLLFLRNWPYVYGTAAKEGSQVQGKYDVAPLPGVSGVGTSTLGGYNAAISAYSDHKATALDFIKYLTSEQAQRIIAGGSLPPVLGSLYDDPELIAQMPYLPALKQSIANAVPRPVTPYYPAVTKAVQDNAYAALKGEKSVDQAITDMQAGIETAGSK
ncbi:ABC transporter substrate-binding protein [Aldersonia sp. NBC_00410]|uniref:ABC transporter substrate-binding protein n=1 Tax=Aldersonia sp. NBC_00410 TaxID=2975954 RepID=UPI0022589915|nr:ABC transporter substrate-binding protein [Aldersonia sp. NBC_00410]MCX5044935.1 ABC transporter substrate-binding protein [Aldersonia sp. NBC_00410]